MLDDAWIARAATLRERVEHGYRSPPGDEAASRELALFCERVAGGDRSVFDRHLRRRGYDRAAIRRHLGEVRTSSSRPSWADTLADLRARLDRRPREPAGERREDALPFEDVLRPWVEVSSRRLRARVGGAARHLGEGAWEALERDLAARLCWLAWPALQSSFALHRSLREPSARYA